MHPTEERIHAEYTGRLQARKAEHANLDRKFISIGNLRLALGILAVLLGWMAFGRGLLSPGWMIVPLGGLAALIVIHEKVLGRQRKALRAVEFYERGLARLGHPSTLRGCGGGSAAVP